MAAYEPPDKKEREELIAERARNVVVDAGAGTGKTWMLINRLVQLVAPPRKGQAALSLSRIAAITFTRRAAGELKLRVRQALLEQLARADLEQHRHEPLLLALQQLDTAFVGTIHSFADRLLRMRPVEAGLSPSYDILEEVGHLVGEVAETLITTSQAGLLPSHLDAEQITRKAVEEAQRALQDYLAAGLRAETSETGWGKKYGLDSLVVGMINQRDVPLARIKPVKPGVEDLHTLIREFLGVIRSFRTDTAGVQGLKRWGKRFEETLKARDHIKLLRELIYHFRYLPDLQLGRDFQKNKQEWELWKEYAHSSTPNPIWSRTMAPLCGWLAARLACSAPVVIQLYEKVKRDKEVVDQTDLLIKLRDMLQKNEHGIREFYQKQFDHILVDEFQDTDPLQTESLFYLAEDGAKAEQWSEVKLVPGKLTIVGDPKQSIYRFRRADIVSYDQARSLLLDQKAFKGHLRTSFRSQPGLIRFYNAQLAKLLELSDEPAKLFEPEQGKAFYEKLEEGPARGKGKNVHVLPLRGRRGEVLKAGTGRSVEAEALARYLLWLRNSSGFRVRDLGTDRPRPVGFGDIAVLAHVTTKLHLLFDSMERFGIPYVARGSTLFLREPVIQQLLLGLRAIADPRDGIAQAALWRPPFFAVDLGDVAAGRSKVGARTSEAVKAAAARMKHAEQIIRELRKTRFERVPSATARCLMENSAFDRALALMPNGRSRLAAVREVLFILDSLVLGEGLDFDGATQRVREWIENPVKMDPPLPVSGDVVQVLTIHQAKGLEFPVVVLWDGFAPIKKRDHATPWAVSRDGQEWVIDLDSFKSGSAGAEALAARESAIAGEERKRLFYVAATRARDLLVIPTPAVEPPKMKARGKKKPEPPAPNYMSQKLLEECDPSLMEKLEVFAPEALPEWARGTGEAPAFSDLTFDEKAGKEEGKLREDWKKKLEASSRAIAVPVGVTTLAHEAKAGKEAAAELLAPGDQGEPAAVGPDQAEKTREGRFGAQFGETVHRVLELILRGSRASTAGMVKACAAAIGLEHHLDEAVEDVGRALKALEKAGLRKEGVTHYPEYPVARRDDEGRLVMGLIDLVAWMPDALWLIDFKTDAPARAVGKAYPAYLRQVELYKGLMTELLEGREAPPLRAALLFTANGELVGV